jgi:GNAT superfamily N-acetyltransferase
MKIRNAKPSDKNHVLAFCQNTFSWGDYIANVWDQWIKEGRLTVIENKGIPIGMCHSIINGDQLWIEGLRVDPDFRRHGIATKLVRYAEKLANRKKCFLSRMLIAKNNTRSLKMAYSLGYDIENRWWLYNMEPKKQLAKVRPASKKQALSMNGKIFSESWKWYDLDRKTLMRLLLHKQIVVCGNAIGIWNTSSIDKDVLQIGHLDGPKSDVLQILKFVQNKGHNLKSRRIQILVRDDMSINGAGIEKRMLFCLMRKNL